MLRHIRYSTHRTDAPPPLGNVGGRRRIGSGTSIRQLCLATTVGTANGCCNPCEESKTIGDPDRGASTPMSSAVHVKKKSYFHSMCFSKFRSKRGCIHQFSFRIRLLTFLATQMTSTVYTTFGQPNSFTFSVK